jgi:16S rRNA (cytidine1402-2'-O)-methyltransferase
MNDTKRQVLPAGLWVVATPIGNLGDLTERAQGALRDANWVLCEDTRRTAQLLSYLGISQIRTRLHRLDAHAADDQVLAWVARLKSGDSIALVTDAGTPSVSDPGGVLVSAAHREGIRVSPVPGVSAVPTLLSVAGFLSASFVFGGFFPRKISDQKKLLQDASGSLLARVFVWFESPLRIQESLEVIRELYPAALLVVGKELTKIHEKIFRGPSLDVYAQVQDEIDLEGAVGEWCFGLEFQKNDVALSTASTDKSVEEQGWKLALLSLVECGVARSEAVRKISQVFGIQKNKVYEEALRLRGD